MFFLHHKMQSSIFCCLILASILGLSRAHAATWGTSNPLMLESTPPISNPLRGARFFVDNQWGLAQRAVLQCESLLCSNGMSLIADQPETKRFGNWDKTPQTTISNYLTRAEATDPGSVPLIATYGLKHVHCGGYSDSRADQQAYQSLNDAFARGIGNHRAVVFLDIDALITMGCLSAHGRAVRYQELNYAMKRLTSLPHTVVYLDAGAADAVPAKTTAQQFVKSGGMMGQGFFLNSTHYDWTTTELVYGQSINRLLPQRRAFVVSTAANGQGPLRPKNRVRDGNEVRCNPVGRGLGPRANTNTSYLWNNAFIWIGNPGRSSGLCHPGDPGVGVFSEKIAVALAQHANFKVRGPRNMHPLKG